ncbi:MAG TPA: hypothetical protein VMI54_06740 [Polyangiaceae bacterium]|nr:hypothetical protein [Polyangiaceae bacterium]
MKNRFMAALVLSLTGLAPEAFAQTAPGPATGAPAYPPNPAYQPAPAYYPASKPIENIGKTGQFIFGVERITGLFIDSQSLSYKDPTTRAQTKYTYKSTSFGLLGVDSHSPSALPRLALDYVVYQGFTVGGSVMLSTRGMSLSGSGQKPAAPPSANDDGMTLFGGVRAGYAYPFDSTFGIWPRLGLSYAYMTSRTELVDPPTGKSSGSYEVDSGLATLNLEVLFAVSPIQHIVVLAGPYADVGLGGSYTLLQESTELDKRSANLTSFGLLVHACGYY